MDDVTIEIVAELRDEASKPLKSLTSLSERLTTALDAMRTRLSRTSVEATALAGALDRLGQSGQNIGGAQYQSNTARQSSEGTAQAAALDTAPAQAALGSLTEALNLSGATASAALGTFATALSAGSATNSAALGVLSGAFGAGSQAAQSLGAGAQSAAVAARGASGTFGQAGSAAGSAASRLSALGSAASSLSGRFASFRLPSFTAHASGGILSTPHLGLVAERGPEAIIPLSASRRARGVELLRQAGRRLGVREYADGGVPALPALAAGGVNVGGVSVNISLSGSAEPSRALELSGARIADQVAQAIADGLERALRNMP